MTKRAGQFTVFLLFFLFCLATDGAQAQDSLPQFNAVRRPGNRILISWTNPFGSRIRQLSIQRSADSTRLFKSIVTLPDPKVLKNGYVDTKSPDTLQYYRLYILLDSGRYIFSKSKRAVKYVDPPPTPPAPIVKPTQKPGDKQPVEKTEKAKPNTAGKTEEQRQSKTEEPKPAEKEEPKPDEKEESISGKTDESRAGKAKEPITNKPVEPAPSKKIDDKIIDKPKETPKQPIIIPERIYTIKRADTLRGTLPESKMRAFRDSINLYTKDTLLSVVNDTIIIRAFIPKDQFVLSKYIFTDKSGLLHIELTDAPRKAYKVRFYEEDKTFLFEVRDIRDQILLIDKANFQHAGWFLYELFDNSVIIEKNRFFIGKDF